MDKELVKRAAAGYWRSILSQLCPDISEKHLSGQHGPCPKCGGRDRWRVLKDFDAVGSAICNQCFSRDNGDGFAVLQWANGWTFSRSLEAVAELLRVQDDGSAKPPSAVKKVATKPRKKADPFQQWRRLELAADELRQRAEAFAAAKPGCDPETLLRSDPMVGVWSDADGRDWECFGFTGWRFSATTTEQQLVPAALHLYRVDGEKFPGCQRGAAGKPRKNHNVAGSSAGWVFVGGRERFDAADVVWKVEGLTDGLALLPILPPHHAIITSTNGAAWSPGRDSMPPIGVLAGKRVVAAGDADLPGQTGAESFAADVMSVAAAVYLCRLPFPLEQTSGADFRDWVCQDEYTWQHLRGYLMEWEWLLQSRLGVFGEAARVTQPRGFAQQDRTDTGNATHFASYSKNLLRYSFSWKKWLSWDGRRWRFDDQGRPKSIAKRVLDEMTTDAAAMGDSDAAQFVAKSRTKRAIDAMISLAEDELHVQTSQLDSDCWLYNCPNGTIDLRTGRLRLHSQSDYITKVTGVPYDPDAQAPRWEQFLQEVFADNPDVIPFVQRWFGACLTGDISEQKMCFFHGGGSNGKSTLLNTVKEVIGGDYAMQGQSDLLIERKGEQHPTELADLYGKRLVICAETEAMRKLAEAKLKALTGGEPIRARRMREDFWEFVPECKFVLVTNHLPEIWGQDEGIWRRLLVVSFLRQFTDADKDQTLPQQLQTEQPGILAWLVRGCLDWQRNGLQVPESVRAAGRSFREDQDVVGMFVRDCCVRSRAASCKASELRKAFEDWVEREGHPRLSMRKVGLWLGSNGFRKERANGIVWHGIGLLAPETSQPVEFPRYF